MSLTYCLDPGTLQSAIVVLESTPRATVVREHMTILNGLALTWLRNAPLDATMVIEQIEAMGMAVGAETFETVFWSGRFYEAWPNTDRYRLARRPIKLHLCGAMQAKDANIRQALLDKFGGKDAAIGRKHAPGPLYGLKGHEFAALAVGVTWLEQHGTPIRAASMLLPDVGAAHMTPPIRTA